MKTNRYSAMAFTSMLVASLATIGGALAQSYPKLKARLAALGAMPLATSSAEYGKLIAEETEKWGKVIRTANIKVE